MSLALLRRALAATLLVAAARPALACSVCSCGDPLAAASEQATRSNALRAALETEWLRVESGGDSKLDQYTLRAIAVYSPLDDLNLAVTVPLSTKRLDEAGELTHATGLGDVELGARWFAVNRPDFAAQRRTTLALSAGASLPTGANDLRQGGVRIDEHGQLGTGGYGPYAGLSYRLQANTWSASASFSGRYRTENGNHYRYGESLLWSAGGQWRPRERFAVSLGVDGRLAQRDREDGGFAPDTGGLVLSAAPGVHFEAAKDVWLSVRAQVPFYSHLYGEQTIGPTVVAGLQYQIF